ncbi:Putative survival protein SurE [Septoria linicola]|uniref:Survival protein SurE n=1 Tax=Septoria linicola TaxID=215465 RepID=A0A9Q9B124_9PEZI|nr:putative survival protein SurE [Septoria linicola]USW56230.1 Putative survival protein SurE [Septoria linicola]
MRPSTLLLALPLATTHAINVVQSNDDGWAEINVREFYGHLTDAGFKSFISAPAENQSGTASRDEEPSKVGRNGCEFHSCSPNSPPTGRNESMPRFNYVNSFPVTSMRHGIKNLATEFCGGPPDIAVAGPNVGTNLGAVTQFSGTVGASVEAAKLGLPAIAFSGSTGKQTAWNAKLEPYVSTYAALATNVTQVVTSGSKPYLPEGIWLNVNFPSIKDGCSSLSDFKFVLSRIWPAVPIISRDDVELCGSRRLPVERVVVGTKGCYASISVGNIDKTDAEADAQAVVLTRLKPILSCLPEDD